jgi:4-alpha-glucanotransferase
MDDINPKELSQKEKDSLDKQMSRLEPKIVDAKHKYEDLVSQYSELFEKRHPEKREERIKEELFKAYQNSNRSLDQILSFMAGEEWDE